MLPESNLIYFAIVNGFLSSEKAVAQMETYNKERPNMQGRGPAFEAADVPDSAYPDGANTEHAIKELRRLKDKPFFLAMSYATTNWGELRNYYGIPKKGPCSDELARQLIHGYYACVSYTDAMIGRLLDELDRLDLSDNTVIILWGDHGWKLGEHAGWCKHTNFELDTHVPMILRVPGMKTAGKRTWALTEYVDIFPTLCDACGLSQPGHLEGLSVMPLVKNPDRPWKKAAFSQYPRGRVMGYSMRTQRFRYTEWRNRKTGKIMARELYDHEKDPQENVNAVDMPQYERDVRRLARMLKQGWRAVLPK